MNYRFVSVACIFCFSAGLLSCSGGKAASSSGEKAMQVKPKPINPSTFTYRFHFVSLGSMTLPHDEIWIDTTGQMTFDTHQHMHDGSWKSPRGLAYLEPMDEDTLLSFIKQDALFSIDQSDVSPQCPQGDRYTIKILRSDLNKELSIVTNTCATEFNLLTGQARKIFPDFIAFINRLRDRYRPLYTE